MPTVEQVQSQLRYSKKQTAYAWAKYYEAEREGLIGDIGVYNNLNQLPPETPEFVLTQIKDLMIELKKKVECPICLDVIDPEKLGISKCGHKYCKDCLDRLKTTSKKCAVCRKTLCK